MQKDEAKGMEHGAKGIGQMAEGRRRKAQSKRGWTRILIEEDRTVGQRAVDSKSKPPTN